MRGQWVGKYTGTNEGLVIINIDETLTNFEGVAYLTPQDRSLPASAAHFATEGKSHKQNIRALLNPVDPRNGLQCSWDEIKHLFSDLVRHSDSADVLIEFLDNTLKVRATSDIGVVFDCVIQNSASSDVSLMKGTLMSWGDFKSHISTQSKSKHIYRGQKKPWRLRTAFHRRGRYQMSNFTSQDVRQLHRRCSAITSHYFNLNVGEENGAFFNLIQHHGYPTPLLDWSHSPYVAAFFAFRDLPIHHKDGGFVRIYVFDEQAWKKDFPQIQNLDPAFLHLSIMEFIAINNPRMVPQQSVTTVTNIDNIEAYVLQRESEKGTRYLEAIDISANERDSAIRELRFMGITAASMFPGIDGICEELREWNFDR